MATEQRPIDVGESSLALLSPDDENALENAHNARLARIVADSLGAIDVAIAVYLTERDERELAALEALRRHLDTRKAVLATLEAAATSDSSQAVAEPCTHTPAQTRETSMKRVTHCAGQTAARPRTTTAVRARARSVPGLTTLPDKTVGTDSKTSRDLVSLMAERRAVAERDWYTRTADRRAEHAAMAAELKAVEQRIAGLKAAGPITASSRRASER